MTTNIPTSELLQVLEQEFAANLRPATLQELGQYFDASAAAVRYALLPHIDAGEIVKLPGARGYMPKWAAHAIAAKGLKRIQDPIVRGKLEQHLNPPVTARVTDCMHFPVGSVVFPNPTTHEQRWAIAEESLRCTNLVVDAILPVEGGYDVIVHPKRCQCGSYSVERKCAMCEKWICEDCENDHDHGV